MNLYAFHSLTLAAPLLIWAMFTLECKHERGYWIVLILLLMTREDVALLTCFVGAYAIVTGKRLQGVLTIVISASYFVAVKAYFMVDPGIFMSGGEASYSYAGYYKD